MPSPALAPASCSPPTSASANPGANEEAKPERPIPLPRPQCHGLFRTGLDFCGRILPVGRLLPLYYRNEYHLSEEMIGLLLGANGVLVVGVEMVFVNWAQNRIKPRFAIALGCVILALSFASLNLLDGVPNLFLSMGILSVAEILAMPFMISWITLRAGDASRGRYLGLYAATYALGHILAPILGTRTIAGPGFEMLWWICVGLALLAALGFSQLPPRLRVNHSHSGGIDDFADARAQLQYVRRVAQTNQQRTYGLHAAHGLEQFVGDVRRAQAGEDKDVGLLAHQVAEGELLLQEDVVYGEVGFVFRRRR